MSERPLILVSNDDGVFAPGCVALRKALLELGEVVTVAPMHQQSAGSHAITLGKPVRLHEIEPHVYAVDGTPADCVYVGLFHPDVLSRQPDIVVSGINHGPNLGNDVFYSGTVAAAREGAFRGIPALAVSPRGRGGVVSRQDPRGRDYMWIGGAGEPRHEAISGSDTEAVDEGYISFTPLRLEMTYPEHLGVAAFVAGAERESEE